MSIHSHQIGFALGAVTREFLRAVKMPSITVPLRPSTDAFASLPGPCIPAQMVNDLSQVPAIVRAKGIDLYQWYEMNTRVATKPTGYPSARALGPLNDLI